MKVSSPKQLKDWINNMAKKNNMLAGTILQNFMMERLLERISSSKYKDNFTIKVNMKLDVTTGDVIIPREIDYSFKLMFEERNLSIKAYNLNTILAEKIESILARNVSNTRARDYYDVYILLTLKRSEVDMLSLRNAIQEKAVERNTTQYIKNYEKYLRDIEDSDDLQKIWKSYESKYPYAKDIQFFEITKILREIFAE